MPLVDAAISDATPPDSKMESRAGWEFEQVFEAMNPTEVAGIRSVFDAHHFDYWVFDEHSSLGFGPVGIPVRIVVRKDQADEARKVIANFQLSTFQEESAAPLKDEIDFLRNILAALTKTSVADQTASTPLCPACSESLIMRRSPELSTHVCSGCGGLWFDAKTLEDYNHQVTKNPKAWLPSFKPFASFEPTTCPRCLEARIEWGAMGAIAAGQCVECMGTFLSIETNKTDGS